MPTGSEDNMKKQGGIKSYFKPIHQNVQTHHHEPPKKKCKTDQNSKATSTNILDNCSIEDKQRITSLCDKFKILDPRMGKSWFTALEKEFNTKNFQRLDQFVTKDRECFNVYPGAEEVWSWTKLCPLPEVKVVILGQDPYHNPGQAHGLSFSVKPGVKPPPSLLNIYKELASDVPGFHPPTHGDLTKWAMQGVLLLNACLTVRERAPNSHAEKGWQHITDAAINAVNLTNKNVVFLLWGAYAQKKAGCVDERKHHILKAAHPSPLSASRGFLGCKHFSKCNELLEAAGKSPIEWTL